jgi:DNA-directed RNA polymerase subunit M/transcription elongation factor TFIIS
MIIDCPKCGSNNVLVGTAEQPNHCSKCGEEWYSDEELEYRKKPMKKSVGPKVKKEDIHVFKSPEVLITYNQDFRRRSRLTDRIEKALDEG